MQLLNLVVFMIRHIKAPFWKCRTTSVHALVAVTSWTVSPSNAVFQQRFFFVRNGAHPASCVISSNTSSTSWPAQAGAPGLRLHGPDTRMMNTTLPGTQTAVPLCSAEGSLRRVHETAENLGRSPGTRCWVRFELKGSGRITVSGKSVSFINRFHWRPV